MTYRLADENEPLIIVMNGTHAGSDGHVVKYYQKDKIYYPESAHSHPDDDNIISDTLARDFINKGFAKEFKWVDSKELTKEFVESFNNIFGA